MRFHEIHEASYEGNVGIMELVKFYKSAPESLKNTVEELLTKGDEKSKKRVWEIVQNHLNVKLKGDQFSNGLEESELLNEATFDLDKQVDFVYDNYFRDVVENMVKNGNFVTNTRQLSSQDLPSSKIIDDANEINPVEIYIFAEGYGNQYIPPKAMITIGINENAVDAAKHMGGILKASLAIGGTKGERFIKEFSEPRIKGSIYHELSHWLDDTFHNKHIDSMIKKAVATKDKNILKRGQPDIGMTPYERDAQIHAIKQLKRSHADIWDELSFEDMLELNPSLQHVYDGVWRIDKEESWKKMILRRMSREGLLGDKMKGSFIG